MLGSELAERFAMAYHVIGTYHSEPASVACAESRKLDVTDEAACQRTITEAAPDLVIHCAGLVDVDRAEADYALAREINALGTRNIAKSIPDGAKLVYVSTDSVFDGRRGGYTENDLPCPVNAYAKTKLEGEWFTRLMSENHLIVRTNFFGGFSATKPSIASWIVNTLSEGGSLALVDDWVFSTLYVNHLVDAILALLGADACGLYHVAGSEPCSKYEFGVEVARAWGLDASRIERSRFADLALAAPRPRDASLDCSKAAALLGKALPSFREGIQPMYLSKGVRFS
jgi:dTDP-4-dehydrorhamnose reductase